MPAIDAMTIEERYKYLRRMSEPYRQAPRTERSQLLDHMVLATGLHRRSLVRLLQPGGLERTPRSRQRGAVYGAAMDDLIRVVWETMDYICATRLTPILLPTARHLATFGEVRLTLALEEQLGQISRPTVQRRLTRLGQDRPRLPRRGPDRANALRKDIPMGRIAWDTLEPGHCETDLVHHCGPSAEGIFVYTLQLIDVATGWSERAAVLGRSQEAMEEGFQRILDRLPFVLVELHPDNDTAFFNNHLMRFFGQTVGGLRWSRSRPYEKNDNRFVEQKNDSLVRQYFGNYRLDTRAQCDALNTLYEQMRTYYNLFQPVMHLVKKEVINGRIRRQWDTATTPYARLLASGGITPEAADRLAPLYATTNPRQLRTTIHAAIPALWEAPATVSQVA